MAWTERLSMLWKRSRSLGVVQFEFDCDGLLSILAAMSNPSVDTRKGGQYAYEWNWYGQPGHRGVEQAKHVMREARRIGLYPTTAQIEAELRQKAAA